MPNADRVEHVRYTNVRKGVVRRGERGAGQRRSNLPLGAGEFPRLPPCYYDDVAHSRSNPTVLITGHPVPSHTTSFRSSFSNTLVSAHYSLSSRETLPSSAGPFARSSPSPRPPSSCPLPQYALARRATVSMAPGIGEQAACKHAAAATAHAREESEEGGDKGIRGQDRHEFDRGRGPAHHTVSRRNTGDKQQQQRHSTD